MILQSILTSTHLFALQFQLIRPFQFVYSSFIFSSATMESVSVKHCFQESLCIGAITDTSRKMYLLFFN